MKRRRRFKQTTSLEERLIDIARQLRDAAKALPPGRKRESLLRKARQNETAAQISDWLSARTMPTIEQSSRN